MYKIIITSHGKLADGFIDTLDFFIPDCDGVYSVTLGNSGIEEFKAKTISILEELENENVLVLADLFNGTPFNVFSQYSNIVKGDYEIIAGVNMSILLDAALKKDSSNIEDILKTVYDISKVNIFSDEIKRMKLNEDDE